MENLTELTESYHQKAAVCEQTTAKINSFLSDPNIPESIKKIFSLLQKELLKSFEEKTKIKHSENQLVAPSVNVLVGFCKFSGLFLVGNYKLSEQIIESVLNVAKDSLALGSKIQTPGAVKQIKKDRKILCVNSSECFARQIVLTHADILKNIPAVSYRAVVKSIISRLDKLYSTTSLNAKDVSLDIELDIKDVEQIGLLANQTSVSSKPEPINSAYIFERPLIALESGDRPPQYYAPKLTKHPHKLSCIGFRVESDESKLKNLARYTKIYPLKELLTKNQITIRDNLVYSLYLEIMLTTAQEADEKFELIRAIVVETNQTNFTKYLEDYMKKFYNPNFNSKGDYPMINHHEDRISRAFNAVTPTSINYYTDSANSLLAGITHRECILEPQPEPNLQFAPEQRAAMGRNLIVAEGANPRPIDELDINALQLSDLDRLENQHQNRR